MNMDMSVSETVSTTVASTTTASMANAHSSSMPGMSAMSPSTVSGMTMAMTFSAGTRVTFLFDGWTTTSTGAYVGAILLLFALSVIHRFLGSLRVQLENKWHEQHPHDEEASAADSQRKRWSLGKRTRPTKYIDEDGAQETEPLSPRVPVGAGSHQDVGPTAFWTPSGPWNWRRDGLRAVLEFIRAMLGYLL